MATTSSLVTRGDPHVLRHLVFLFTVVILYQVIRADSSKDVNGSYTICMDTGIGCEVKECQDNYTNVSDITFPTNISQVNVKFCSEEFLLNSVLEICAINNPNTSIAITGLPTNIVCENGTGIHITCVNGLLTLQGISLTSCGSIFNDSHQQDYFMSSIFITLCHNVTIENVAVSESKGNGLTMFDNSGTVTIYNCSFKNNKPSNRHISQNFMAGGSGLHIVLSYCHPRKLNNDMHNCNESGMIISNSVYNITKCNFIDNAAYSSLVNASDIKHELAEGFNRGGGLSIVIDRHSMDNKVLVMDSKFTGNSATWGGGLYVAIVANSSNNSVTISNCTFYNNNSPHLGGGGAIIGYQHYQGLHPQGNSIIFEICSFESNSAQIGGGVSFYTSPSTEWLWANKVVFRNNCIWIRNRAKLGSAMAISQQVWDSYVHDYKTEVLFSDCNFTSNYRTEPTYDAYKTYISAHRNCAFLAVGYHIVFENKIHFGDNNGSGIHLDSAEVEFKSCSNVTFTRNKGLSGGAINMQGFSALILNDNITISFLNNSADLYGGAIYQQSFDKRDFLSSQRCFIQYNGKEAVDINVLFENNSVGDGCKNDSIHYGRSIFAETIIPCINSEKCSPDSSNIFDFIHVGNFTFIGDCNDSVSTSGGNITMDNETVNVIPGKIEELPITTWNDLSREVLNTYKVTVQGVGNSTIIVDNAYTSISNKLIKFYGSPRDRAYVTLESIHNRKIVYKFQIEIQECPPGFVHDDKLKKCVCSVNIEGISCNEELFKAQLLAGYWMGYDNSSHMQDDYGRATDFIYSFCPFNYCLSNNTILPNNTCVEALDEIICSRTRTGKLCQKCQNDFFTHYHHSNYNCKNNTNCNLGWLFYLVSEIVPVTVFFIVVILFNINFTDGAVNGFILFVQISDTMLITGHGLMRFPFHIHDGLRTYKFLIGIFSLKFFEHNRLSFCLWRGAAALDLLAFKYITILYASTLVVIIIVLFKYCHNKRINNILVKIKGGSSASIKSTIIYGISGFLVICYSECTRISLSLLTPAYFYASNKEGIHIKHVVSFYNSEFPFFHGKHLFYALPALFIVLTFGLLPPLILISYPLCYKVFTLIKINETKFTKLLCTFIPLEKFKPFFDNFQSSFKDEYRLFSGLYFFYRLTTLLTFAFIVITYYYVLVQIQFAVIFTVHVLCQPYKKRWHNILDGLLFLNLSLINLLSMLNFQLITREVLYKSYIKTASSTVQIILLFLPLLYISLYSTVKVIGKIKRWKNTPKANDLDDYHKLNNFLLSAAEDRLEETD